METNRTVTAVSHPVGTTIPVPSEETLIDTAHDLLDLVDAQIDLTHGERLELLTRASVSAALAIHAAIDRLADRL